MQNLYELDMMDKAANETNSLSRQEAREIYKGFAESQKNKFAEQLSDLIQNHIDERKSLRKSFGLECSGARYRNVYRELYSASIKALTDFFGFSDIKWS